MSLIVKSALFYLSLQIVLYLVMMRQHLLFQAATFAITHKKLYVPIVTLLTQDNAKLLPQLNYCTWALKEQLTGVNINQK